MTNSNDGVGQYRVDSPEGSLSIHKFSLASTYRDHDGVRPAVVAWQSGDGLPTVHIHARSLVDLDLYNLRGLIDFLIACEVRGATYDKS